MQILITLLLSALISLPVGFIWYHPKVFGTAWMQASGMTEEKAKGANMALTFSLTYVFSFFLAGALYAMVVHQTHLFSLFLNEPGFKEGTGEAFDTYTELMAKYGRNFRWFGHGMIHGLIGGITIALPITAVNAMFERKGFKYIAINAGFWTVCMILMGAVICQFA